LSTFTRTQNIPTFTRTQNSQTFTRTQNVQTATQSQSISTFTRTENSQSNIIPTRTVSNTVNLCGTSSYNVNCTHFCNIDSDCKNGFSCFKVNINNNLGICNFNNFCGSNFERIDCNKPCPNGVDLDCENGNFCFKDKETNKCKQIPVNYTTTSKTTSYQTTKSNLNEEEEENNEEEGVNNGNTMNPNIILKFSIFFIFLLFL
jgi:hypothetical protein